jgi:hypothetical protein
MLSLPLESPPLSLILDRPPRALALSSAIHAIDRSEPQESEPAEDIPHADLTEDCESQSARDGEVDVLWAFAVQCRSRTQSGREEPPRCRGRNGVGEKEERSERGRKSGRECVQVREGEGGGHVVCHGAAALRRVAQCVLI